MSAVTGPSWLNAFDPNGAAALAGSLNTLLAAHVGDPANATVPAGFNVLQPATLKPAPAPAPSQFQQALDALTTQADTFLIQSALNGYQPLAAPAAFGSPAALYQTLNATAQTILSAGQSGNYGNVNALA
ncbi:MAG: hypothetical protein JO192_02550 [Candidatus Eremiobacteraeota bacterium]|nr:hypothetical protein [Candidatus Eremiobacteraeota bacterium]MBV8722057.1 hypothetical protein [Candidatus Eremiobacteraeota bacterium]